MNRLFKKIVAVASTVALAFSLTTTAVAVDVNEDVNEAKKGVVQVIAVYNDPDVGEEIGLGEFPISTGSGFLINDQTVITAYHVMDLQTIVDDYYGYTLAEVIADYVGKDVSEIKEENISFNISVNRDVTIKASVRTASREMDYAILTLEERLYDRTYIPLRQSSTVEQTETCYALGFPAIVHAIQNVSTYTTDDVTVSSGSVTKIGTDSFTTVDVIQTNTQISNGDSGGPLVDINGNVIGINVYSISDKYYYAIAIDQLITTLNALGIDYTPAGETSVLPTATPAASAEPEETTTPSETPQPVDKSELETAIDNAEDIDTDKYTEDSVAAFSSEISSAKDVLNNSTADETAVEAAVKKLNDAMGSLEEAEDNTMIFILIGVGGVVIVGAIVLVIMLTTKKKTAKTAPAAPVYRGPNQTAPQTDNGTTVLNNGSADTTVLNSQNYGTITRTKTGEKITINNTRFVIGKERARVNYCVSGNTAISRSHIALTAKGSVLFISDMGTTNGTIVNGNKLNPNQEVSLSNGAKIIMGDEEFVYNSN